MIVSLKNVRLAFCQYLFTPGAMNAGDKPAYSSTLIMEKGSDNEKKIRQAMAQLAIEKWTPAKGEKILQTLVQGGKICLRDGDEKSQYDGFEGMVYVSARSSTPPLVIDRDKIKLSEGSGKIYAGCYVNASIDIWAQDNQFGKRINATLRGIQFVNDGEAFVGSAPANEDEFPDLSTDSDDLAG